MGHHAKHVSDVSLQSASDRVIWDYAVSTGTAIITKDEDFAQRRALVDGPAIIWVRLPNARRQDLLVWFEKALPAIIEALDRGEGLIEVI